MRQNITVSLEKELIRKIKVLAAQEGTSISGLLTKHLKQLLGEQEAFEAARKHALSLLDQGFHLGGTIPCTREQWHER